MAKAKTTGLKDKLMHKLSDCLQMGYITSKQASIIEEAIMDDDTEVTCDGGMTKKGLRVTWTIKIDKEIG